MNRFKCGDRVQVTASEYDQPNLAVGQTGVVADTFGRNSLLVCMDSGPYRTPPDGDGWIFLVEEVRKIEGGAAATAFPSVPAAMQTFTLPRGEDLQRADASPPSKFTGFVVGPFFCHHVISDDESTMMGDRSNAELGDWQVTHVVTGACVQRGLPTHYRAIWLAEKLSAFQDFNLPSFQTIKNALAPHEEEIASLRWVARNGNCQRACNFSFTGVQP